MDTKNVIAAISLSAAVIILYSLFFAPTPQELKQIQDEKKVFIIKKMQVQVEKVVFLIKKLQVQVEKEVFLIKKLQVQVTNLHVQSKNCKANLKFSSNKSGDQLLIIIQENSKKIYYIESERLK